MVRITDMKSIAGLFADWEETMIDSCLQGCMGMAFADRAEKPESAGIRIGDFGFLAGKPDAELLRGLGSVHGEIQEYPVDGKEDKQRNGFMILVPKTPDWEPAIEDIYGVQAQKVTRYATRKEPQVFERKHLEAMVCRLPEGFELRQIDTALFEQIRKSDWAFDLCSQFADAAEYERHGLGFAVLKQGQLAAGASSYTYYRGGIEIEVDTKEEFRRRGLAGVCGARLILECLETGRYPSWDAQNRISLHLAESLGYRFDKEYTAYEVILK